MYFKHQNNLFYEVITTDAFIFKKLLNIAADKGAANSFFVYC